MSNSPQPWQYRDDNSLEPPWLQTGNAERYLYTIKLCRDILVDKANQAAQIRLPGQGDPSQIPYLANDRVLVQGPKESNDAFCERLQGAFPAWKKAGSRISVLEQLQYYLQGLQPSIAATMPEMTIVGGAPSFAGAGRLPASPAVTTWDQILQGTPLGDPPIHSLVPNNWNWDGTYKPWRSWLILFMSLVPMGISGADGSTSTQAGTGYGMGANVNGIWVPNVATPLSTPFLELSGLSGIPSVNPAQNVNGLPWITITGATHPGNNGTFPITQTVSPSSCWIANPKGIIGDTFSWSLSSYPFIGPSPVWGTPGVTWGQGEITTAPLDTGSLFGGIWKPANNAGTSTPTWSFGLTCSAATMQSLRQILKTWKSGGTYYPDIIVAFDGGTGVAGSAFSPLSSAGSGNPDGTFGGRGNLVDGVWVPNRLVQSPFDAYCQGTGTWPGGGVEVT